MFRCFEGKFSTTFRL